MSDLMPSMSHQGKFLRNCHLMWLWILDSKPHLFLYIYKLV